MRNLLIVVFGSALLFGCSHAEKKADAPAPATPAAATKAAGQAKAEMKSDDATKLECTMKKEVRSLEIRDKNKGCELAYTKGGKESVVASSGHGSVYCKKAMDKLEGKLKASGYACK